MSDFGEVFDAAIKDTVNDVLIKGEIPDVVLSETDNLGEVVEKLCILHIRTWMLEDAAQEATTDEELGALKRKIDICFKQKRPRLVQAINRQVSDAIVNNTTGQDANGIGVVYPTVSPVSISTYEEELNEAKRNIIIPSNNVVEKLIDEMQEYING